VRPYAAVTAGFILLLLPLASYLVAVPEVHAGFAARYGRVNVDVLHHPRGGASGGNQYQLAFLVTQRN
jgi:hypothetical protein